MTKKASSISTNLTEESSGVLRPAAEKAYAHELQALREQDKKQRPPQWQLSPQPVRTYLLGGKLGRWYSYICKVCGPCPFD